jgi:hypothetical protein
MIFTVTQAALDRVKVVRKRCLAHILRKQFAALGVTSSAEYEILRASNDVGQKDLRRSRWTLPLRRAVEQCYGRVYYPTRNDLMLKA